MLANWNPSWPEAAIYIAFFVCATIALGLLFWYLQNTEPADSSVFDRKTPEKPSWRIQRGEGKPSEGEPEECP